MKKAVVLSRIARDPEVAAFLERGERNVDPEPIVAVPPKPRVLTDGAAEKVLEETV